MDAELMTIFQNINALVEQAKQMMGGEAGAPEVEDAEGVSPDMAEKIMKYLKGMDGEETEEAEAPESDEVEKAEQAQLATEDEGTTASDDAEEVVGDQGDVNEDNIAEVAKMIANALVNKSVKKSEAGDNVKKALSLIVDEQKELRKSVENILGGLGVADEIKKLNDVQKSQPVNDQNEIKKSLDYIKQELGIESKEEKVEDTGSIHKSLSGALSQMVNK